MAACLEVNSTRAKPTTTTLAPTTTTRPTGRAAFRTGRPADTSRGALTILAGADLHRAGHLLDGGTPEGS